MLRNHASSSASKGAFCPPCSIFRHRLRERARLLSDRGKTASDLCPWGYLFPLCHRRSHRRSLAMVRLFESGYADQNDIARCFGYSARSLRRYQERLKVGGLSALARPEGRPSGSPSRNRRNHERDRTSI